MMKTYKKYLLITLVSWYFTSFDTDEQDELLF